MQTQSIHTTGSQRRENAAEAFVDTLAANGIDTFFGLPGSTEAALLEALRANGEVNYVLSLQESITVAMADGYARASGAVGVVGLHTSVGTMNGMSQLYNAYRDGSPIVVTAGHKDVGVLSEDGFCALPDLGSISQSFTKWSRQSLSARGVAADLRRAIQIATAPPPGPTYLAIPEDFMGDPAPPVDRSGASAYAAGIVGRTRLGRRPEREAVAAAVRVMMTARRPVLVIGSAATEAATEARALAAALEIPVFVADRTQLTTLPYPVLDERYVGMYGEDPSMLEGCDCVIAIGTRVFYPFTSDSRPKLPPGAHLIHAHSDPEQVGWTVSPEVGLSGDPLQVFEDLRAAVEQRGGIVRDLREERVARLAELRARHAARLATERSQHGTGGNPVPLTRLAAELGARLPADALVFDESISSSRALLRHATFADETRLFRTSGGSLGWGLPAAIGAKIAHPKRPVLAVIGDGSFHFTVQAIWTAVQQQAPVTVVVVDNTGYLAVKRAVERFLNVPEDPMEHPGTALPAIDHVTVAKGYGAIGTVVRDAEEVGPAIDAALASGKTNVIVVPVPEARS